MIKRGSNTTIISDKKELTFFCELWIILGDDKQASNYLYLFKIIY
jgi:hypothetical protein